MDLFDAGTPARRMLLRSVTTQHEGLHVIAAPPSMMPLESLSSEQVIEIVGSPSASSNRLHRPAKQLDQLVAVDLAQSDLAC